MTAGVKHHPTFDFVDDVTPRATEVIEERLTSAVRERGRAVLCLSGGSTPLPVFRALAERTQLPWEHVFLAWGDERWVPPDDEASNFGSAKRALLDHVPVPAAQVMAWPFGDDPHAAARSYAATLLDRLGTPAPRRPLFDVNLLGLGSDGHTASLFPGTGAALRSEVAFASEHPTVGWRLTLSAPTLSSSRSVLFLVSGEEKRRALTQTWGRALFADERSPAGHGAASVDEYPARAVTALEELRVITDVEPA